jgi:hypothetical protein
MEQTQTILRLKYVKVEALGAFVVKEKLIVGTPVNLSRWSQSILYT